ncbi:MAG: glycosyltransferase N-terminal domain-containing protein [Rickettsiaceae bacterium]|nr:glycosyltransferase N-terminal domain-containing protein [Rickettsiaceae bacterium]
MIQELMLILLSLIFLPVQMIIIIARIFMKKEDPYRVFEKFGIRGVSKLPSPIWLHAASVGESNIALTLIDILSEQNPNEFFLITTGTKESCNNILGRIKNKPNIKHQFVPIDNYFTTKLFVHSWKPKIGIFIESEIWPVIIHQAGKIMPLIIANAIMSDRSYKRWSSLKPIINWIGGKFSAILTQSKKDYRYFKSLGFKNVKFAGNIKFIQQMPFINLEFFDPLKKSLQDRDVIFAASTHSGDDQIILKAYKEALLIKKNLLLIIAPRHPRRADEISELCKLDNLKSSFRSQNKLPDISDFVFILDTIGEMHNIFSLGCITIMGGSFFNGGHNILEPASYSCPIIFGPNMSNFPDIRDEFLEQNAAIEIQKPGDLGDALIRLMGMENEKIQQMKHRAHSIIASKHMVANTYKQEIQKFLK